MLTHRWRAILFLLGFQGFKVFGLEDLAAVETFHVIDAVSSGKNLYTGVVANGLHNSARMKFILTILVAMSSPPPGGTVARELQSRCMPFPIHRLRRLRAT